MKKFCFLRGWVVFLSKKKVFFMQNFSFCEAGCSFWYLFLSFLCHFLCKNSVFCEGGWPFWVKKKTFFSCKISDFAGLGALFGTFFCHFFVIFLKSANPARRSARSARGLTRDAKAVSGKPEGTILVWPASFASHCRPPTPLVVCNGFVFGYTALFFLLYTIFFVLHTFWLYMEWPYNKERYNQ